MRPFGPLESSEPKLLLQRPPLKSDSTSKSAKKNCIFVIAPRDQEVAFWPQILVKLRLIGPLESSEPKLLLQRPPLKSDFTWKSVEKQRCVFLFCLNTENAHIGRLRGSIVAPTQK